jgi:Zn finger protein HypA/HybF involved in hydrogenase expression
MKMINEDVLRINLDRIIKLSRVEAEPIRHGHWEVSLVNVLTDDEKYLSCSLCGGANSEKTSWCPNCGAKMDEVKDEAD